MMTAEEASPSAASVEPRQRRALDVILLVGCPRSGTTWLAELLGQHPSIVVSSQAKLLNYLSNLDTWRQRFAGHSDSAFAAERLYALCRDFAGAVYAEAALAKPEATAVVDRTPENLRIAEFALQVFPTARFLHAIRDPRAVFSSLRSAATTWAAREFPSKPVDGGRFWRREVTRAMAIQHRTPHYAEVRYESLSRDGVEELRRIYAWLGLPSEPEQCRRALENCGLDQLRRRTSRPDGFFRKGEAEAWRGELSRHEIEIIEFETRDLMERLGYPFSATPIARRPWTIAAYDTVDGALSSADRLLERTLKALQRRWRGRQTGGWAAK
jgi:hypothetical protein